MDCEGITREIEKFPELLGHFNVGQNRSVQAAKESQTRLNWQVELIEKKVYRIKLKTAEKIFGKEFFGSSKIGMAFELSPPEEPHLPEIPFSKAEMLAAKEQGMFLIYRPESIIGMPLTLRNLEKIYLEKSLSFFDFYQNSAKLQSHRDYQYFNEEQIRPGWALVSKKLLPQKNYDQQMVALAKKARTKIESEDYLIRAYYSLDDEIKRTALKHMLSHEINLEYRPRAVEVVYDLLVYNSNMPEKLFGNELILTSTATEADGTVIAIGWSWGDATIDIEPLGLTQIIRDNPAKAIYVKRGGHA